jgi:hypothetical protein
MIYKPEESSATAVGYKEGYKLRYENALVWHSENLDRAVRVGTLLALSAILLALIFSGSRPNTAEAALAKEFILPALTMGLGTLGAAICLLYKQYKERVLQLTFEKQMEAEEVAPEPSRRDWISSSDKKIGAA